MEKRGVISLILVLMVVSAGVLGYSVIEGWTLLDALYMTVITVATIGFQEVHPLSNSGRGCTIILVLVGVGVVAYVINNGIRAIIEGEFQNILGRRKLEKRLAAIRNHFIVCGYGRMGSIVCKELQADGTPFVVIEKGPLELDADNDMIVVHGDATKDECLGRAGIERAKGLISVLSSDAQNLYVVLSARGLNPNLLIVARAGEDGSEQKLVRAGADRVVCPYHIGGLRVAHSVLKPAVVDFLEYATSSGNLELQMEEIVVEEGSALENKTILEIEAGRELVVVVIAVKRKDSGMKFNPAHKTHVKAGDTLIALGERGKIGALNGIQGVAGAGKA